MKPTPGLCTPVAFRKARDGDTVEVSIPGSAWIWAIRLIDVWAPELHTGEMRQQAAGAKAYLAEYLNAVDPADLLLYVPLPNRKNILSFLTFDRIPGVLWAGDENVNEMMVKKGYAASKKGLPLGT